MRVLAFILMLIGVAGFSFNALAAPAHAKGEALPPGLQKNVERGKPLPPGWQKKLHVGDILDGDIYARGKVVVPADNGIVVVDVEGIRLRLEARTRKILHID